MKIMDTRNGHDPEIVDRINELHSLHGSVGMLDELLKWLDNQELSEFSEHLIEMESES